MSRKIILLWGWNGKGGGGAGNQKSVKERKLACEVGTGMGRHLLQALVMFAQYFLC